MRHASPTNTEPPILQGCMCIAGDFNWSFDLDNLHTISILPAAENSVLDGDQAKNGESGGKRNAESRCIMRGRQTPAVSSRLQWDFLSSA